MSIVKEEDFHQSKKFLVAVPWREWGLTQEIVAEQILIEQEALQFPDGNEVLLKKACFN